MKSRLKKFTGQLEKKTEEIRRILETMPYRGDSSDNSQKILLLQELNSFEACINGLEAEDLQELKEDEEF